MATNPATQSARRKRLRAVERLILDGRQTEEIFDALGKRFKVAYSTIRKDVVAIRKAHLEDIDKATELEGSASYLARTVLLRIEAKENGFDVDDCGLVCDDCYKKTPWGSDSPEIFPVSNHDQGTSHDPR